MGRITSGRIAVYPLLVAVLLAAVVGALVGVVATVGLGGGESRRAWPGRLSGR